MAIIFDVLVFKKMQIQLQGTIYIEMKIFWAHFMPNGEYWTSIRGNTRLPLVLSKSWAFL
ncbi:hypothetical protein Patl1_05568 [Pistacia atlantica]|uniref:Uncharacterized protein n=1 Tax=Pistacia atlantica TaxID=434234 RepID=A0ACC1BV86_9ROSI|nr:hypothetical protein Patl1_05568 [Pistacia atlantica]